MECYVLHWQPLRESRILYSFVEPYYCFLSQVASPPLSLFLLSLLRECTKKRVWHMRECVNLHFPQVTFFHNFITFGEKSLCKKLWDHLDSREPQSRTISYAPSKVANGVRNIPFK